MIVATVEGMARLEAAREVERETWREFRKTPSAENYERHRRAMAIVVAIGSVVR